VLDAWPRLSTLRPAWFLVAAVLEAASFTCTIALQRLVLGTRAWFPVATAALVGNAVTSVLPAGDAAGATAQFGVLSAAGIDTTTAVGGMSAASILNVGGLLALPVLTLPAVLGRGVARGLVHAAVLGAVGFAVYVVVTAIVMVTDRPLEIFGRLVGRVWGAIRKRPVTGLDQRLVRERNTVRATLGRHWSTAVLLVAGRLAFDYAALLATLRAAGAVPRPWLVLVAYSAANVIALVPLTPGGLGVVEASLGGTLVLAGVPPATALLATLAYRIVSYWLPLFCGIVAYALARRRYGALSP
jgi:uncharacterized protein (TIRG00374 family)